MVRRKHRLLSLLTALAMLLSLMSGFTVFAEEEPGEKLYYGLKIGSPFWDEQAEKQVFDAQFMGGNLFCEAGRHFDFTIGWQGSDGSITPLTEEDMASVVVKDSEGQPVDIGITPTMYGYPDESTGRWEEAPAGDGIYRCCFRSPGEYTVTYELEGFHEAGFHEAQGFHEEDIVVNTVTVEVQMPVVALYADDEISEGSLIGDEVTYMPGNSYYILADPLLDDGDYKTETEILDFEYDDWLNEFVTLEEVKKGEIYKVTVAEGMEDYFSIRVIFEQDDYRDEGEGFHKIREAENDIWINFNAPLRLGLVADWTQWSEEDPDLPVVNVDNLRGTIGGYEIGEWNTFTFGWKTSEEDVALIPTTDVDKFTAYDEKGNVVTEEWIRPAARWSEEADKDVELGAGFFDICFSGLGRYKIIYASNENLDNAIYGAVWANAVYLDAEMPEISIYSDETVSLETLLGSQIEYKDGARTFYANVNGETTDTFKKECTLTGYEFQSPGDADGKVNIIENGEKGYKIEISDDFSDQFNIRLFLHIKQSRLENDEWIDDGEWDRDYWTEFTCWTPERFGLVADWTQWDDEDPDKPVVFPETMRDTVDGYQIMDWNTFTFGWKGEDGEVTLIPSSDIDKFTAYAEDGTKITEDWIHPVTRYNPEKDEDYLLGDGFFDIRFTDLGIHKIVYDSGESLESEDENVVWSDTVIFNAVMPEVSLYSSETVSRETLIGSWAEYTDDERTFYVNILNDEGSDWKKEVVLRGFELEGPSDVSQNVNVIAANDGGYKVVIKDGYKAHFNLRVFVRINQYRKEDSEWRDDGGWDRDYWIEFDHWEPEYYGLCVAWPWHEGESLPEFPDEFFTSMGFEAKADRTLCICWKTAKGKIVPIKLNNINSLHLYDPDGNEVTGDWIRKPVIWDGDVATEPGIDGMFEVTFPGTGTYVIKIDKDISGEVPPEGMAVTNECEFYVEYPDVGIYSEAEMSDDALIGEHVVFTNNNRVFYVITADHEDMDNIFTRTIESYEVIMPYGFEDKADDTVAIEKINDHTLKVTVAENAEAGFDLELELFSTNKYYDPGLHMWVDSEETWTDMRMLNFWPKEIIHYGLVAGFPNPPSEGGPMGNMQQYLDGFFELYGNSLVFGWRNSAGEEVQICEDDLINHIKVLDEDGKPVDFELEKQDNDDYIYDIRFLQQGLFYVYYNGDLAVNEKVEDTVYQDWIKVWVDPPILAVYDDAEFKDETLVGLSVEYQPDDKLVYYLAGTSVGDERGSMESYVKSVSVYGVKKPDFVKITKNEDGTAKVEITKLPNKDYDGKFKLSVTYCIDSREYDEMGELIREEHEERTDYIDFVPGDGFATGKISVSYTTEGATPAAPQLYIYNRGLDKYFDLEGNELSAANRWVTVPAGTTFVIDNLIVGCYNIVVNEESLAVDGFDLDKALSNLISGGTMVEDGKTTLVELRNVYKSNKVVYPYKNEWKDGVWYNADGTQTYQPKASWKHNTKGYWYGDTSGWYAKKSWVKIDGKNYYFDAKGYMAADEYIDGYYLTKTGAWDGKGKAKWKGNATKGWWYSLPGGSYLKNCWAKIDGKYYYFKANGYAAKNEWVKGYYWIGSNCVWTYKPKGSWHKDAKGYWFGDTSGWYAKSTTIVIDGKSYTFNAKGYMK